MLSKMQLDYIKSANHRWNIKSGATRSGKTYCDFFMIPKRIRACSGNGIIVLLGNTVSTLCRNIIDPMRELWGEFFVGFPSSGDTVYLFGKKCWLIGAGRGDQVSKLQGSGIEYAYGDEITTWNEGVFQMLKSRLDKANSVFDGTCNPSSPDHWFKTFLDSNADIFLQNYTIDDNPFLNPSFVSELKKEYSGTVYYDRYILGKWATADGLIFRKFADRPDDFLIADGDHRLSSLTKICVGVDFGGNKSGTAFVACGFFGNYEAICALSSERHLDSIDSDRLGDLFCDFIESVESIYGGVSDVFCDSAEPILIRSLKKAALSRGLSLQIKIAAKKPVVNRIRLLCRLIAQNRFFITSKCKTLSLALRSAVWLPGSPKDERRDDGTTDIDSLDAFEYCFERDSFKLCH